MNRIIDKFPSAYINTQTPYNKDNFHEITKEYCKNCYDTFDIKSSKVIVIGDLAVGKTSLINCFCKQLFQTNYKATIGVDFEVERFQILGVPFHLQIWDTAGQERFKCIAQSYYRYAQVIVVVFDLNNIITLKTCKTWLDDALNCSSPNPHIFLVGTKKDLLTGTLYKQREITALKVAKAINAEYWPVSSKKGDNVSRLFYRVAALTFDSLISTHVQERKIFIAENEVLSLKKNKVNAKSRNKQCCNL